jgi:hypothetical protein
VSTGLAVAVKVPSRREVLRKAELSNGDLLLAAEAQFDALVTTDQNLRYRQNFAKRKLAILVLPFASWPKLERRTSKIVAAIEELQLRGFVPLLER